MIPIKNIYYMLAYAFQTLNEQGYKKLASEQFDNAAELCAAILSKGVSMQIKRGLGREYISRTDALSAVRGKIDISESLKSRAMLNKQLVCSFYDFSVDSYMNRIIKTTMLLLVHSDISKQRKKELIYLLNFFDDVSPLGLHDINWNMRYNRNNQTYRMLIYVCRLVIKGLVQSKTDGTVRVMDFFDEQRMCRLYEKFILEYYRKEFPQLKATSSQILWAVDDGIYDMLPVMQSDVMLSYEGKILIIDAKYYSHTTQSQCDVRKIHSHNLYQIFTYVKNKEYNSSGTPHIVSGMILYAKTDEAIQPDKSYMLSGNRISVRTLDLDCDFADVSKQLNMIIYEHFGKFG